jgi:hypothetical protein
MNGAEQQAAGTRYGQLSKQLEDTQLVVQALAAEIVRARQAVEQAVTNLATAVDQLQADVTLLKHDDVAHERVIIKLRPLAEPTFLGRLSWLLTGRT